MSNVMDARGGLEIVVAEWKYVLDAAEFASATLDSHSVPALATATQIGVVGLDRLDRIVTLLRRPCSCQYNDPSQDCASRGCCRGRSWLSFSMICHSGAVIAAACAVAAAC